ncbi:MAG: right-handed parallel beta-helix repeat-containing protein [Anaeromyxobacteraceae bacterium]
MASPPACRFRKLGDALAVAIAASTPTTPTRAVAAGWTGPEVVFSGEILPLEVPAGVTLTTADAAPTVTHYTIAADVPSLPAVTLRAGGRLSGFKIRAALPTGAAPAAGVAVTCAAAAEAHIHALRVEAAATGMKSLANAMTVSGPCAVTVADGWFDGAVNDGVIVQGTAGEVAFHGSTFTANGKSGLSVLGGRVTVDGPSTFRSNKEHGLALRGGEAAVIGSSDAAVEFAANGGDGILAGVDGAACQLAVTAAHIHDNGNAAANPPTGAGIEIVNNDPQGAGRPFSITLSTLAANAAAGLKVLRSSPLAGGPSLTIDSVTIAGGVNGVLVQPTPSGSVVHASLTNVTVTGASDGGVLLNQASGSDLSITGSSITGNCASTTRTLAKQLGGGLVFLGSLPAVRFTANTVTGNQFDQILVASSSSDTLTLGGGGCQSPNRFVCSTNPPATAGGAPRIGLGIRSTGAPVAATFNAWTSDPPDSSRDFAGNVDADGSGPGAGSEYCTPIADACEPAPTSCAPTGSGSTGLIKGPP